MKTIFEYNGRTRLKVTAEGAVEELILQEMDDAAAKGSTVVFTPARDDKNREVPNQFVLEVGK